MAQSMQWVSVAALMGMLWCTNAVLQARLHPWLEPAGWAAVLATASACLAQMVEPAWADQWLLMHRIFKPLGVGFAIIYIAFCAYFMPASGQKGFKNDPKVWLLAALGVSVMGDVWLMLPGFFVQGLASFLIAHVFFIALFRQGIDWFPSKLALVCALVYGALMLTVLWPYLATGLKAPVAAYVVVITLMGAQAFGRASVLKTWHARWVAVGALLFMASDSLLAWDKFVAPIPLGQLWVLGTYFSAQLLIARWALISSQLSSNIAHASLQESKMP